MDQEKKTQILTRGGIIRGQTERSLSQRIQSSPPNLTPDALGVGLCHQTERGKPENPPKIKTVVKFYFNHEPFVEMPPKHHTGPKLRVTKKTRENSRVCIATALRLQHLQLTAASRAFSDHIKPVNALFRACPRLLAKDEQLERTFALFHQSWTRLCSARESLEEALRAVGAWDDAAMAEVWFIRP